MMVESANLQMLQTEVLSIPAKRLIKTQIRRYEKLCGVPRGVFTGNFDSIANFGLNTNFFFTTNFAADATLHGTTT
jgi:hypothetical protein